MLVDQDSSTSEFGGIVETVFVDVSQAGTLGCKWCLRAWTNTNPIHGERFKGKDTLQSRNARGYECKTCPQVLSKKPMVSRIDEQKELNQDRNWVSV